MKKFFTLFAAALLGVSAFAQMPETCPSELGMQVKNGAQTSMTNARIQLTLVNSSENLNGFNTELECENENVTFKTFSATNYANVILARWEGTTEIEDPDTGDMVEVEITDAIRKQLLTTKCDVKYNVKENGNLVIIELLSTNDCRFFPVLEEKTAIGEFGIAWTPTAKADEEATLLAPAIPSRYSFAYTGGVEGTRAWTPDAPLSITLVNDGTQITEKVISAISTINTDKAVDNRIFDLQGRELQSVPEHGIYIQNGKKYVK